MDFKFFESLSQEDARKFLNNYLDKVGKAFNKMIPYIEKDGITVDFSIDSIPDVWIWFLTKIRTVQRKPDLSEPEWVRRTDSYLKGLIDFDQPSSVLVLRASYYLGECFIRYSDTLRWSTGDPETIEQQMPVVTGFKHGIEMAPMMVTQNVFSSMMVEKVSIERIESVIKGWLEIAE